MKPRWIICGVVSVALIAVLATAGSPTGAIEVDADRLNIDSAKRSAHFEGNVKARYRDIRITCGSLQVTWDSSQRLISLQASGGVRLIRDDAIATADRATLVAAKNTLSLSGNPVLSQGGNRLSGKQIDVNLNTSEINVMAAKGTFVLGAQGQ